MFLRVALVLTGLQVATIACAETATAIPPKTKIANESGPDKSGPGKSAVAKKWRQLFNGRDLKDWVVKIKSYPVGDNHADTFRVEDGILKVSYDKYQGRFRGRFGHLFYKEPFSHYLLRVEYRFVGEQTQGAPGWAIRNSGLMLHGQTPKSMELNQDFPISAELQLLGGDGTNSRSTSNLCTPGTNVVHDGKLRLEHCMSSSSKTYHGNQWVVAEAEVHGNGIVRHKLNGVTVFEYSQLQLDNRDPYAKKFLEGGSEKMISKGTISLQSEGHPIEFRKVELLELPQK